MASLLGMRRSADMEVAIAIGDHTAADANCGLPFKKGDRFLVHVTDANWWKAKREDNPAMKGKVPSNLVVKECDVDNYQWISFNTERPKAEQALRDSEIGSFIIRSKVAHINDKEFSKKNNLALSVKTERTIVHYLMFKIGTQFRIGEDGTLFDSLNHLANHYASRRKNAALVLKFSVAKGQSVVPWEYDERQVTVGAQLDKGHFGTVYSGKLNGEVVALKTPNLAIMEEHEFIKEAELARPHKHVHILETIGICRIMNLLYIITEFMANGSLKKYFRNHELTIGECVSVSQKIASAMEYLHAKEIIHRDLAARNVLVGASIDIIKVCDFGLARSLETSRYYITKKETFPHRWTAPEGFVVFDGIIVTEMGRITYSADVWSFGVVMWELFTNGKEPYETIEENDLLGLQKMLQDGKRLDKPEKCPEMIYAKMLECWQSEKKDRPTFADLQAFLALVSIDDVASPPAPQLEHSDTDGDSLTSSGGGYNQIPREEVEDDAADENIVEVRVERKVSPAPLMVSSSPDSSGGELVRPTSFNLLLG